MAPSTILTTSSSPIPSASLHLMPFHIDYTGPAPIQTYFHLKPVENDAPGSSEPPVAPSLIQRVKARFIASFRGRLMHGMELPLPEGFGGVVLRSDRESLARPQESTVKKPTAKSAKKGKGRTLKRTRSATKLEQQEMDEDEADAAEMDCDSPDSSRETHLTPMSTFGSFILWNADNPVDENGGDEYLRALNEWPRLAAEIHRRPE